LEPDYDNARTRALARARALKWLNTKDLFNEQNFPAIMKAVDPIPNKNAFDIACQNAGLVPEETKWLWAYLKECNKAVYKPIPEAAISGW
jgi:hypothetical protein